MQSTLTAAAMDFIPEPIRRKLQLKPGTVLDFDELAPYLKAVPQPPQGQPAGDAFQSWLASSIGLAKGRFTTDELMRETRG